jgi:hypothetical protein
MPSGLLSKPLFSLLLAVLISFALLRFVPVSSYTAFSGNCTSNPKTIHKSYRLLMGQSNDYHQAVNTLNPATVSLNGKSVQSGTCLNRNQHMNTAKLKLYIL